MLTSFCELRKKDVVSIKDGTKLGNVGDIEIDTKSCRITSLIIFGKLRFFGLFGREEDIIIDWDRISIIGEDTILVNYEVRSHGRNRRRFAVFTED